MRTHMGGCVGISRMVGFAAAAAVAFTPAKFGKHEGAHSRNLGNREILATGNCNTTNRRKEKAHVCILDIKRVEVYMSSTIVFSSSNSIFHLSVGTSPTSFRILRSRHHSAPTVE